MCFVRILFIPVTLLCSLAAVFGVLRLRLYLQGNNPRTPQASQQPEMFYTYTGVS